VTKRLRAAEGGAVAGQQAQAARGLAGSRCLR
jgi:hypothetical protein